MTKNAHCSECSKAYKTTCACFFHFVPAVEGRPGGGWMGGGWIPTSSAAFRPAPPPLVSPPTTPCLCPCWCCCIDLVVAGLTPVAPPCTPISRAVYCPQTPGICHSCTWLKNCFPRLHSFFCQFFGRSEILKTKECALFRMHPRPQFFCLIFFPPGRITLSLQF